MKRIFFLLPHALTGRCVRVLAIGQSFLLLAISLAVVFPTLAQDVEDALPIAPAKVRQDRDAFIRSLPVPIRVAGEFGPLSGVLLSANELVHFHPKLFAGLVEAISERVPVIAIVRGPEQVLNGREALEEAGVDRSRVHFLVHDLDSMWIRDYGPIFLRRSDGTAAVIDTYYRARDQVGGRELDDKFPIVFANALDLSCMYVPLVMEGGNFIHNGRGLGVSTTKLFDRNEFRGLGGEEFVMLLNNYFALKDFAWIPPLPGEPTGHSDMFVSFLSPLDCVVAEGLEGESSGVSAVLDRAASILKEQSLDGEPIRIHRIPMAPRKGELWRSYTNILLVDGLLLMPSYSDIDPEIEDRVEETYQRILPEWEIRRMPADELVEMGGFLHCLTLGVPRFIDISNLLELSR